ncbi:phosphonate metabolism transcriptional regulator PhnF [Cypionkella sp.]|uniref:phosphonate metabolism transcriptional regulator PhnF n=1 Tax=Cypionkella sp. TaxID=2811411 RepID=UPI002608EEBF|nr:phosphonate metabolism transcriptional regulator PhnF [Cypionkella sp.]MDB5665720.1 phnF [Cypionkella sp.]
MTRLAIWKSIADTLSGEISANRYGPGDKLPTEAELAARFGVNRHTVRHAIAALVAAGTVHSRRGAGVFVTATPTEYALGRRVRFHQNVMASGRTPSRQILRLETCAADARETAALALHPGALVHVIEGLSFADAAPLAVFRSVFPAARFAGLLEVMGRLQSITAALAELGLADYTRASTAITAVSADPLLALHLRLATGAAVLRSVAVNVDLAGVPVEFGTTWFAGERVTLTVPGEQLA